jgi:hypothetical protein
MAREKGHPRRQGIDGDDDIGIRDRGSKKRQI